MAETSNTTSDTDCSDNGVAWLRLSTGRVTLFDDDGDEHHYLSAVEAVELLDLLSKHETRLRDAAQAAEDRQRWDEAYRIASDLMGQGHKVREIGSDLIRQIDGYRSVMAVKVDDLAAVEATGAKVTRQPRAAGSKYEDVMSEPVPGIVVAATVEAGEPREVTDPSVAPAVTR